MITVSDVRKYLNDIPEEHISDDTIRLQIRIAEAIIENEKSSTATQQLIDNAILAKAGELTYIAYTTEMERSLGVLPPAVATHIEDLRKISDLFLSYVKRGTHMKVTAFDLSSSIWDV